MAISVDLARLFGVNWTIWTLKTREKGRKSTQIAPISRVNFKPSPSEMTEKIKESNRVFFLGFWSFSGILIGCFSSKCVHL